jgi:predicted nucleic acid-binding protein
MIVVDTNVIGYLYLSSEKSELVERILLIDAEWAAPILWRGELRNVLAMYIRQQRISLANATQIMDAAISLMRDGEYEVNSNQVLRLTASSGCSAYDCEFAALALALDVPLVTVDRQLLNDFPALAISLDDFLENSA